MERSCYIVSRLLLAACLIFVVTAASVMASTIDTLDDNQVTVLGDRNTKRAYREILVGLVVDGQPTGELQLLHNETQQLIPLDALSSYINSTIELLPTDAVIVFTPGGDVEVPATELFYFNDVIYIKDSALNTLLFYNARFDQSEFALTILLPWNKKKTDKQHAKKTVVADYRPQISSLQSLRVDHSQSWINSDHHYQNSFRFTGNLQPGGWVVDIEQDENDIVATDYYWIGSHRSQQWLVGKQFLTIHPLLGAIELTGVQLVTGSNDRSDLNLSNSRNNFATRLGRANRDIHGVTKPGYIAALRINQRVIATTRVRLDGTYEFLDIDLPSRNYNDIQVEIYNRISGTLIEIKDYSQTIGDLLLNDGEHTTSIGLGELGNSLRSDDDNGFAGYLQTRYGLTPRITVEAGYLTKDQQGSVFLGTSTSIGKNLIGSFAIANDSQSDSAKLDLDGHGKQWQLNSLLTYRDNHDNDSNESLIGSLYYRYSVNRNLLIGLRGEYLDKGIQTDENYLLPGFTWQLRPDLNLSAWPISSDSYRTNIHYRLDKSTQLRYEHEDSFQLFNFEKKLTGHSELFYSALKTPALKNLHQLGYEFRTNASTQSLIRISAFMTDDKSTGF